MDVYRRYLGRLCLTCLGLSSLAIHAGELAFDGNVDVVANASGGLEQKTALLGLGVLSYSHTLTSGEFALSISATAGGSPSDYVGDAQGVNNASADDTATLYDFWYRHDFSEQASLLVGMNDYNAWFSSLDTAGLFINSSFGIGPDISQAGPSIFPSTTLGAVFHWQTQKWYGLLGVYDGVPGDPENPHGTQVSLSSDDGVFTGAEWGYLPREGAKLAVGAWSNTAPLEDLLTGAEESSNQGVYAIGEYPVTERVTVFAQAGLADDRLNAVSEYFGVGGQLSALGHSDASLGFALAHARASQHLQAPDSHETVLELTYDYPVGEHWRVQPDVQYVMQPSFDSEIDDAWVVGLRVAYSTAQ